MFDALLSIDRTGSTALLYANQIQPANAERTTTNFRISSPVMLRGRAAPRLPPRQSCRFFIRGKAGPNQCAASPNLLDQQSLDHDLTSCCPIAIKDRRRVIRLYDGPDATSNMGNQSPEDWNCNLLLERCNIRSFFCFSFCCHCFLF